MYLLDGNTITRRSQVYLTRALYHNAQ